MGAQRGHDGVEMLPSVADRLFQRAGFDVLYPSALASQCCGQPFESKGLLDAANLKSAELEAALREASEGGRWPIVFDTSPCAYRMKRYVADRLKIQDSIEFVHDAVLPRLTLTPQPQAVAVHPVCSVRKMGTVDKLMAIAARCSAQVVTTDEVQCCGFAGDRGFIRPELNEHALRHLKAARRLRERLFDQPHLRDRAVGAGGVCVPVDPGPGGTLQRWERFALRRCRPANVGAARKAR
jgi:D-lactate dehydrogenase